MAGSSSAGDWLGLGLSGLSAAGSHQLFGPLPSIHLGPVYEYPGSMSTGVPPPIGMTPFVRATFELDASFDRSKVEAKTALSMILPYLNLVTNGGLDNTWFTTSSGVLKIKMNGNVAELLSEDLEQARAFRRHGVSDVHQDWFDLRIALDNEEVRSRTFVGPVVADMPVECSRAHLQTKCFPGSDVRVLQQAVVRDYLVRMGVVDQDFFPKKPYVSSHFLALFHLPPGTIFTEPTIVVVVDTVANTISIMCKEYFYRRVHPCTHDQASVFVSVSNKALRDAKASLTSPAKPKAGAGASEPPPAPYVERRAVPRKPLVAGPRMAELHLAKDEEEDNDEPQGAAPRQTHGAAGKGMFKNTGGQLSRLYGSSGDASEASAAPGPSALGKRKARSGHEDDDEEEDKKSEAMEPPMRRFRSIKGMLREVGEEGKEEEEEKKKSKDAGPSSASASAAFPSARPGTGWTAGMLDAYHKANGIQVKDEEDEEDEEDEDEDEGEEDKVVAMDEDDEDDDDEAYPVPGIMVPFNPISDPEIVNAVMAAVAAQQADGAESDADSSVIFVGIYQKPKSTKTVTFKSNSKAGTAVREAAARGVVDLQSAVPANLVPPPAPHLAGVGTLVKLRGNAEGGHRAGLPWQIRAFALDDNGERIYILTEVDDRPEYMGRRLVRKPKHFAEVRVMQVVRWE